MKKQVKTVAISQEIETKLYIAGWILWFALMFFMIGYAWSLRP